MLNLSKNFTLMFLLSTTFIRATEFHEGGSQNTKQIGLTTIQNDPTETLTTEMDVCTIKVETMEQDYARGKKLINLVKSPDELSEIFKTHEEARLEVEKKNHDLSLKVFELFDNAYKAGCVQAEFYLGLCYEKGIGGKKDLDQAFVFYFSAAKIGCPRAQFKLAEWHNEGIGILKNEEEALYYFKQVAEAKVRELSPNQIKKLQERKEKRYSEYSLEDLKAHDNDVKDNIEIQDLVGRAQFYLAECYANGKLVSKNERKAFKLYKLALDRKQENARVPLANYYRQGITGKEEIVPEKDEVKIFELYKDDADEKASEIHYEIGKDYSIGRENYEHPEYNEKFRFRKDEKRAFWHYNQAAIHGNVDAQYAVACCYRDGTGVARNEAEALKFYTLAADKGNERAREELAKYTQDLKEKMGDIKENEVKAFEFYKLAKGMRIKAALIPLAQCYENGTGIAKDEAEAATLYEEATARECLGAKECLAKIKNKSDQRDAARKATKRKSENDDDSAENAYD